MEKREFDFYKQIRKKIDTWLGDPQNRSHKYAKYILLAPDFLHLLIKLSLDPQVPKAEKAKLAIAIAYFITPFDLIPEAFTGPIGFLEDISMAAYVLNSIILSTNPEIIKKHWAGEEDILNLITEVLHKADEMLGKGLWDKILKKFDGK